MDLRPGGPSAKLSPARTLLSRGAGWRIALYAVFRKTALATLSSAAKGGSKGQGWDPFEGDQAP